MNAVFERRFSATVATRWAVLLAAGLLLLSGASSGETPMTFQLTSSAFQDGQKIPTTYTADGANYSPPLAWSGQPSGTVSFALICDDPDAPRGTWVHWVLFNLRGDAGELPEHVPPDATLANGAQQGKNDFGKLGYGGPAPPPGKPHRYLFKLYALDTNLKLPAGAIKDQLVKAMEGHVLGEARLMGKYQR
jgi:Raf kinase inhibitor-like YbhB/YbcL family protein